MKKSASTILLEKVEVIENNSELTAKFREKYIIPFSLLKTTIEMNLIQPDMMYLIEKIHSDIE